MSNNNSVKDEKEDQYIEKLLESFLEKGDGENILDYKKLPTKMDILRHLKIFKKRLFN